ncbi:P27 protein [Trypanosoma theileri]|uniref:p27 protein n=1 Tax=Trypanosoma theileri TaxID=67003 RepID=A0A1X0NYZ9_9TRYP|nr:P27 protein [Trypanosoma theileri]ORC89703.1 P27 protein [Trypanosoma theileri]
MSRVTSKMCGGMARANVVDHGVYVKPITHNPYVATVHDGVSTGYLEGFSPKPLHWLYRFRYNLLPQGFATGFFSRNPYGRYVHWLEVSTIEKMRLQANTMEALPARALTTIVVLYTIWFSYRLAFLHPDITLYNVGLWTTKPWIAAQRFNKKQELDQPVYRWVHRAPEYYITDPVRELTKLGVAANDPWVEYVKSIGRGDELLISTRDKDYGVGGKGKLLPLEIPHEEKSGHSPGPLPTLR